MNTNEKISLLLRHSDRDDIPKGSFGNEILLNEKGIQNAISFGESLADKKINRIFTSPVERCIQTAEYITKGYGRSIEIIKTTALGAPGLHITDEKIAGDFFLKHGLQEIYKQFVQGKKLPGFASKKELYRNLTTFIQQNSLPNQTTLFITHDLPIAMYHFACNGFIYEAGKWINFLQGLILNNGKFYNKV